MSEQRKGGDMPEDGAGGRDPAVRDPGRRVVGPEDERREPGDSNPFNADD